MKIKNQFKLRPIGALVATLFMTGVAQAGEFTMDNGIEGRWSVNASVGTNIRAKDADSSLIMAGNGGSGATTAGTGHGAQDDGNLNFKKGDAFSTIAKVIGEVDLKKDNFGLFVRGKAWHDYQLANKGVASGSSANGYQAGTQLNDSGFDALSKFSGTALLDAYVSMNTFVAGDKPVTVKVGNQVVNWGESLFISGINQFNAFDISAARKPGTQVKEILLPIPQISFNLGVAENTSLEAFYQFDWKKNILDGCGTYWGIVNTYNCSDTGAVVAAGPLQTQSSYRNFVGGGVAGGVNAIMSNGGTVNGKDSGQWGLAGRYFSPELSTEFGAYYVNYNQRSPILSILFNASTTPGSFYANGTNRINYVWDYSAKDIQVLGLSMSTNIAGWSVFGEASHTKDLPVQINGPDLLLGAVGGGAAPTGLGPLAYLKTTARNEGVLFHGYGLLDKNQVQLSTVKSFPNILGAESLGFVGEVAYQHWSGIGDPSTSIRYGRGFVYGQAATATLACNPAAMTNCENDGFATKNAWGYRGQFELSYPNLFAGVNVKPRLFFSHDVSGYSADGTFVKDRKALGLGTRFDYLGKYYADLSMNHFNRSAKYDIFRDRDFYSVVVGVNF
jgi:Protein of unknown function (DUF1302)